MMDLTSEPEPKFDKYYHVCDEQTDCPDDMTCFSYRQIYFWRGEDEAEWMTGHACFAIGSGKGKREVLDFICPSYSTEWSVTNDHIDSYVYEEIGCELD